jgi:hypothetical protein
MPPPASGAYGARVDLGGTMAHRGSDPCGCPSWSDVDPTVRAVAEAMARRDGFAVPAAAGVIKNFLPLAEVAVAEVRRLDAPVDPLSAPIDRVLADQASRRAEPAPADTLGQTVGRAYPVADATEAVRFLLLVENAGALALSDG